MIYERVKEYCRSEGIPICEFEKRCEIGNGTVSKWREDKSSPSVKTLSKIVRSTGIEMLYWLGGGRDV